MEAAGQTRVLLIGAGGHARVCLEALQDDPTVVVVGAVSRDRVAVPSLGVAIVGTDDELATATQRGHVTTGFVAVGDNSARRRLADAWASETGLPLAVARSAASTLSRTAVVADGVALLPGCVVNAATTIGRGTIVNTNASVDHDNVIGAFVHIAPGTAIGGDCTIGDGAFLGIGSRVLPGRRIGAGAIVGAGAVVTKDVPDGETVVGVPARRLERRS